MEPNGTPSTPLETLGLSVRAANVLRHLRIRSIEHLCTFSEYEVLAARGFGETTFLEVRERLAERGLSLRPFAFPVEQA